MAHLDKISSELIARVAREIAAFLDPKKTAESGFVPETNPEGGLVVAEVITVWQLKEQAFEAIASSSLSGDIAEWIEEKPFALHHQIRTGDSVDGFARSGVSEEDESAVYHISSSEFASMLNALFEDLDRRADDDPFLRTDPVIRLLEIPPYQISALWMFSERVRESRLEIVRAPERYGLRPQQILDSRQFFAALSRGPILDVT